MKYLLTLVLSFSILLFTGCGGGGGSSSDNTTPSGTQINKVADANAFIELNATQDAIEANASKIEEDTNSLTIKKAYNEDNIGKAIFVDGEFRGLVNKLEQIDENSSKATLKDAQTIDEAYQSITLDFSSGEDLQRSLRALSNKRLRGKYDYLNPNNPIKTHFFTRTNKIRSGLAQEELILRVDIPKNYIFPAGDHLIKNPIRSSDNYVSCTFDLQACVIAAKDQVGDKIELGTTSTIDPNFTISTEGSYIEYKIGAALQFSYTNIEYLNNQPTLAFNYVIDAEMDLNLQFEAKGEASRDVVLEYDITDGFALEIYHPGSALAKTSIFFQPKIEFGASAKIEGTVSAKSKVKRKLQIKVDYKGNSADDNCNPKIDPRLCKEISVLNKSINYKNDAYDITESELSVDIEAQASAWASPNISVSPQIKLLRVTTPIYLGEINGGSSVVGSINGKIGASYLVDNSKGEYDSYAQVGIDVKYYFYISGQFYVEVGDNTFLATDPSTWYRSDPKKVFDWSIRILKAPNINVNYIPFSDAEVSFTSNIADENISKKIRIFYTTDGSDPIYSSKRASTKEMAITDTLAISETTTLKAVAVLKNRDISDSLWAFGESISAIVSKEIVVKNDIDMPKASPRNESTFSALESLSIYLTQRQDFPIYYTINGDTPSKMSTLYSNPIEITQSTTIKAVAYNGDKNSSVAVFNYYVYEEQEGICSQGYITYKPTWCYGGEDGCWEKRCNKNTTCHSFDSKEDDHPQTKTLEIWSERYEPDSKTNELYLYRKTVGQLVTQPGGYQAICHERSEVWSKSGVLNDVYNEAEITQNAYGCWYSGENFCKPACNYSHKGINPEVICPESIAITSSSQEASSSSSSQASSSSSSQSSSSEASSSSSSQIASSSSSSSSINNDFLKPIQNPDGYTGIRIWVYAPNTLGMSTYGEIQVHYVRNDYDKLVQLEDKDISTECSYSVTEDEDIIDVSIEYDRVEVTGKKSGKATINVTIPTQYTQDADYVNDTVEVTVTL